MEQSAVSHQLRLLRNLGLVTGTRSGKSIIYSLNDDHVAMLLDETVYHIEHLSRKQRPGDKQVDGDLAARISRAFAYLGMALGRVPWIMGRNRVARC